MKKYQGTCHCERVRFQIETDEPLGPYFRCNCSLCSRKGAVMGQAERKDLRITAGEESLSLYRWNTGEAEHYFCKYPGGHPNSPTRGHLKFPHPDRASMRR